MFKFKSDQFSEFAQLGDLRQYKLEEISALVKDLKREERVEGQINYVTWTNDYYVFVIEYDLHGNFRKINSQNWIHTKFDLITKFFNSIR